MVDGDLSAVVSFIGILVQLGGELLLLLLFVLLRRYVLRRAYFTAWTLAWASGAVAILALSVRYVLLPSLGRAPLDDGTTAAGLLYFVYQVAKLSSLALFVSGTATYVIGSRFQGSRRLVMAALVAYSVLSVLAARADLHQLVIWQAPVAVVCLGACSALLFTLPASRRTMGSVGGGAAFTILAVLWLVYGVAFNLAGHGAGPAWAAAIVHFNTYFDLLLNFALGFAMVVLLMEDAKREVDDAQAELRVQHDQLQRAALFDSLTDSLNRTAFAQGVGLDMARGTYGTVVIADLDNLKAVNDAHGHAAGDLLLRQCAEALRGTLRPYDKLYRWGGDEFLLIIPGARGEAVEARLREVLRETPPLPIRGSEGSVKLEVSLGTSDYTSAEGLDECIQLADQAMYRQKHARKTPFEGVPALATTARTVADY
jgi:diguanylate cyclase (GGDEF)-like protein